MHQSPFDRCDRESDYARAWEVFGERRVGTGNGERRQRNLMLELLIVMGCNERHYHLAFGLSVADGHV